MSRIAILCLLLFVIYASPVHAVRNLPAGFQPEPIEGQAVGNIPQIKGSGTLTFINTGGEARLLAVCGDLSEERARVNSLTCEGIDVTGTFTGGPNGIAVFNTGSGEIKLQLTDGKVFSFSTQGFSMNFTVTDPSIFDAWVEDAGARDSGARVSDLSGQVEIACPPDLEAWDVMKMGRVIYVDCHLKTGEDSSAVISFSDMTTFEMKSESEIVIDTPPEKESKLSLIAGNIWVDVKQMVKDGTMKVHMSQAVAGIKGTKFILTETGSESSIKVIEGVVNFESRVTGKAVDIMAGESVIATVAGLSEKTTFDPLVEQKNWRAGSNTNETKSVEANNPSLKIIYVLGIGMVLIMLAVTGVLFIKKKKTS
ncbi:MAG: FecR family protein [Candidatus Shapirobacteria bacterium]